MLRFEEPTGLFKKFEVNSDPFWPRIPKLLGGSVLFHALLILVIALVPPVRDALSLALFLSGGSIVDRPYTKTQIENEGDITEITTEKFQYPAGYFAMDQIPLPTPTPTPLPVIASASYELIRFSARHGKSVFALLTKPGMWLQRITTQPPADDQVECAIKALDLAMELEKQNGGELVIA